MRNRANDLAKNLSAEIHDFDKLFETEFSVESSRHGSEDQVDIVFRVEFMGRQFEKVFPCPSFQTIPGDGCPHFASDRAAEPEVTKLVFAITENQPGTENLSFSFVLYKEEVRASFQSNWLLIFHQLQPSNACGL